MRGCSWLLVLAAVGYLTGCASVDWVPRPKPKLIAFNPEDDLTSRATQDGRFVLFVSERNGNLDIWVRDFGRDSTYPLTQNPADDFDPALVPGRERLVFVSRRSDAKGDLYLADGLGPGAGVERLTDASTQDRQPVVSPDGQRVYFTAAAGVGLEFIAELDFDRRETRRVSPTSGFDPTVSPDGRYLIYTAPADPSVRHPHLVALRLSDSATVSVSRGTAPAGFATFLPATAEPYALAFVRFADDDNGDGSVDARDRASLWRVDVDLDALFASAPLPRPYPLTDGGSDELFPDAGDGQLYFTQGIDQQDIRRLPPTGMFPVYADPGRYLDDAKTIDDPRTRWFALRTALARAGLDSVVGAQALLTIGRLHLLRGVPWLARRDFGRLVEATASAKPGSPRWTCRGLAEVEAAALDRAQALQEAGEPTARDWAIREGRRRIEDIARRYDDPEVRSLIALESAELLIAEGERTRAVMALEAIGGQPDVSSVVAARAMLRRIELLGIVHDPDALSEAYAQVTERFPEEQAVVNEAAGRLVEVHLEGLTRRYGSRPGIDALRRLVVRFGPGPIRRAARWKLVEDLKTAGDREAAALELDRLYEESIDDPLGQARALRALAEIQEARGEGESAVDAWRKVLRLSEDQDLPGFESSARAAISRVNLAAATASVAAGDLEGARRAYREVIDNDPGQIEAHRRYIGLSARRGRLDDALRFAERRARQSRRTPVARYAYALALTWQDPPALDDALEEVEAAIELNPQFTQAYLLRGWIREMQELEEPGWLVEGLEVIYERVVESIIAVFASDQEEVGQRGLLELAVDDYKTALRLNNEATDPRLEAEILLNLGNGHYRLADETNDPPNMRQAFIRYTEMLALPYAFDVPSAEMVFWERFGRSAYWEGEYGLSAMATRRALALSGRLQARERRLQQLGNLALAYDQAREEAYAKEARRILSDEGESEAAAGRAAIRLREKARARFELSDDQSLESFEMVLAELSSARTQLDRLEGDPRELPTLWIALGPNPTSAQYGFGPRAERNVNLALAESAHRALGDIGRANELADERAVLAQSRFDDIPGAALGFVNQWPTSLLQVRERLGLLMRAASEHRRQGRWPDAWTGLEAADKWLEQTVPSRLVSGSRPALWLERARWAAIVASWQAAARAEGHPPAPDEPPIDETLAAGEAAIGQALALVRSATATEPLAPAEWPALWTTPRTEQLPPTLSTTVAVAKTASVARGLPTLLPVRRQGRGLAARLEYARGLNALAESRASIRAAPGPQRRSVVEIFGAADRAAELRAEARGRFERSALLAAGAGPGLGHRVLVSSLAAWAHLEPVKGDEIAASAEREAVALARAIGEERLAWSVRWGSAAYRGGPAPSLDGVWPGFLRDELPLIERRLATTASRALARGEVGDGFGALERILALRTAVGPVVELDNRRAPGDRAYVRRLQRALRAYSEAGRELAESQQPSLTTWRERWAGIEAARDDLRGVLAAGETDLSGAAQLRLFGVPQSAGTLPYILGPDEVVLLPANVLGKLELILLDGSTDGEDNVVHVVTDASFSEVLTDLDGLEAQLEGDGPPDAQVPERLRARLFDPVAKHLVGKRAILLVGGYLGRPVPRAVWPDGPAWTHLYSASTIPELKAALQVGGAGSLRLPGPSKAPSLGSGRVLTVDEAVEFRIPPAPREPEGGVSLDDRRPVEVLPDQVFDIVVAEAPLRLETAALERSAFVMRSSARPADAYRFELPLGRLTTAARTLVLGRTQLDSPAALSAALRLDATLAVTGFSTTVVLPEGLPAPVARSVVERLAKSELSTGAALVEAQDEWRARSPAVDRIFIVGDPGLNQERARSFARGQLRRAQGLAVRALSKGQYELAIPYLERWIKLQRAAEDTRRIEGIYGALVGVLRDKVQPPRPARAADVQAELLATMSEEGVSAVRVADARVDLGHLLSRAHDFPAAEAAFEKALEVLRTADDRPDRLARAWFYYGLHKSEQKAYESAAVQLERSIDQYEKMGVYRDRKAPSEARRALLSAGELYLNNLSDPIRAERAFARVRRYATTPEDRIAAEIDLARAARRRGAFLEAAGYVDRAQREAVEEKVVELELDAQIEAANVAWYQGDYRLGQELCQRSLRLADRLAADMKKSPVDARTPTGRALRSIRRRRTYALSVCGLVAMSQRDFDGAVGYLEEARGVAERLGDDREVATQLNNLGRVYLEFGQLEAAVDTFRRAQAIDERLDDRYAQAYDLRNIGRALALQGVRDEARVALEKGLAYAQEVRDANNQLRSRFALAQLDLDEGRTDAAARRLAEALPLAERQQVKELEWQIHRYLGRIAAERGDLAAADASLERAVEIARTITGRSAPSEFAPDRFEAFEDLVRIKLAQQEPEAAFQVSEDARRLRQIELLADGRLEMTEVASALRQLKRTSTSTQTAAVLAEVRRVSPRLASMWTPTFPTTLTDRLPPDAAVVQYEVTGDALVIFVFTADGLVVRTKDVSALEVRQAVSAFGQQMTARADMTVSGQALKRWLLDPIMADLRGRDRVAFVMEGILRYVPVPALPLSEGRLVIDRFEVVQALDARAGVDAWISLPPRIDGAVVALGGSPPAPGAPDRPLPFAVQELQAIAEEHPQTERVTGGRVTRARVLRELAKPRQVFHFAGHSYLAGSPDAGRLQDPLGGQLRTADGGVTMLDVLQNPVGARLVVLSTCSSLLGTRRADAATGEDILSMAESLQLSGADAILGSTIDVDDVATALLMKRFYRAAKNAPAPSALRSAQQTARGLYGHPAWWAGFTLWVGPAVR